MELKELVEYEIDWINKVNGKVKLSHQTTKTQCPEYQGVLKVGKASKRLYVLLPDPNQETVDWCNNTTNNTGNKQINDFVLAEVIIENNHMKGFVKGTNHNTDASQKSYILIELN